MTRVSNALNTAVRHHQSGRLQAAVDGYRQILHEQPDHPDALHLLGVIAHNFGNDDAAIELIGRAIQQRGHAADFHYNLATAYSAQRKTELAVASFVQALKLNPNFFEAHYNLGNELRRLGELTEAAHCYRTALNLRPDFVDAHINLGLALESRGLHEQAIASYSRALALNPRDAAAHSNLLLSLQNCPGMTLAMLLDAHREFDRLHAAPLHCLIESQSTERFDHNRLRLGFVSADLGRHPVGYFLVRLLENLDRDEFETYCYSDRSHDDLTHRIKASVTHWHDVRGVGDEQLAKRIRADRIDILFDLAGHTANNRLLVFARKPAPIQVTWAGYACTTGLKTMDYILADHYQIPAGSEQYYQERPLRMSQGYVCYDPPEYAPAVNSPPVLDRGHVTFGCFNNPNKINPQTVVIWSAILQRVPDSRLILKYKGWNDKQFVRDVIEMFAKQSIDASRLEFLGQSPHPELLAAYNRVDIALDTFPYSGGLTTCEALWMGVPVVTCPGETFASRHSLSHLSNVGLTETIASSFEEYVSVAVQLASDVPRLTELRATLRDRMAASPLCDGKRFSAEFASILLEASACRAAA